MAGQVITKISASSGTHLISSSFYGTCSTAAATAAKEIIINDPNITDAITLVNGMTLAVKFTNSNSVASPKITVYNNIGTAASPSKGSTTLIAQKSIMRYGTTAPSTSAATSWTAGAVVLFIYDGTNWVESSSWDNNTTTNEILEAIYPVGSVYINASNSTNPATLLGFGTWSRLGTGRVMIDADSTYAAGETGGSETHDHGGTTAEHTLTIAEIPAHTHGSKSLTGNSGMMSNVGLLTDGATPSGIFSKGSKYNMYAPDWANESTGSYKLNINATHEHSSVGGDGAHSHTISSANNMPPWIGVYIWKRTA